MTEISSVTNNATAKFTSKSSSGDDDCPKIYIPSSSDLAANPGAGGSGGGGTTGSGGFNTDVPGYNSPPSNGGYTGGGSSGSSGHNHSNCYGSNGSYWYYAGDVTAPHSHTSKSSSDCPEVIPPAGYVPVSTMPMIKILKAELNLSSEQVMFLRDHQDTMGTINSYLTTNNFSQDAKNFAEGIINQSILNPNMNFDILASSNSPMNIDRSTITNDTPEGKKFNTVYEALTTSPEFKKLFIDMFGDNSKFNVKFIIGNVPNGASGDTKTNLIDPTNNIITIDVNFIKNNSKLVVAKTILHECIHAFLNVKLCDGQLGNIPNINNNDFYNIVNQIYNGFNSDQAQHNFIYTYMLPTMEKILVEIKDKLVSYDDNLEITSRTLRPLYPNSDPAVPFSWSECLQNLSLSGLQNSSFFKKEIGTIDISGNPIIIIDKVRMNNYNQYNNLCKNVLRQ